jgi:primosomal replication protein N
VNAVALRGQLTEVEPLRHTPAGIPLLHFRLQHRSLQIEAGFRRQVECEMSAVAMGEVAVKLARLQAGHTVRVSGFINRRNRMSKQLILHATEAEISEDDSHGNGKTG